MKNIFIFKGQKKPPIKMAFYKKFLIEFSYLNNSPVFTFRQ